MFYLIVLPEMLWVQRFTKRQFLGMPQPEVFRQRDTGIECLDTEVDITVDVSQIRELYPQLFVHWCEVDDGVGVDAVLVQRPARLVQPDVPRRPPDGVVGPVHRDVCNKIINMLNWK